MFLNTEKLRTWSCPVKSNIQHHQTGLYPGVTFKGQNQCVKLSWKHITAHHLSASPYPDY